MTAKKIHQVPTPTSIPALLQRKDDERFSFSEDAINLATKFLPRGYQKPPESPDTLFSREEKNELVRKSIPKILGENTLMAWVFVLMVFEGESLQGTAGRLKEMTGKGYSLKTVKSLYIRALERVAVLLDETAKKIREEEREERIKRAYGPVH